MEPIAIVKKRSRIWLLMALLIIALLLIAGALWFMGDVPAANVSRAPVYLEMVRSSVAGAPHV
jgi:hypothetical protein